MGAIKLSYYNEEANFLGVFSKKEVPENFFSTSKSVYDYYPFGMLLPNTNIDPQTGIVLGNDGEYRYGFQGQEKDDEIKGEGNSVNYKYRMHDTRIGRFFAIDPLASKYPHNGVYNFSENKVIAFIELEGLEAVNNKYRLNSEGNWAVFETDYLTNQMKKGNDGIGNRFYDEDGNELPDLRTYQPAVEVISYKDPMKRSLAAALGNTDPAIINVFFDYLDNINNTAESKSDDLPWYSGTMLADGAMEGTVPIGVKYFVKIFPPTAMVIGGNTLVTGEDMDGNAVSGAWNRVISPTISVASGVGGIFVNSVKVATTIEVVSWTNTSIDVVTTIVDDVKSSKSETGNSITPVENVNCTSGGSASGSAIDTGDRSKPIPLNESLKK